MKTIGKEAFCRCTSIAKIALPNGLEKIDSGCFAQSGIEEIVLPTSVREIGEEAFSCCR